MRNISKYSASLRFACIGILVATVILAVPGSVYAYSPEMRKAMLAGPWEIAVQVGDQGHGLGFPISVSDPNKPEKLDEVLPVMGTAMEIILEQYISDLRWEASAVKKADGGVVARLAIKGPDVDQSFWLNSDDPAVQSMSSPIGGVALKKLHNADTAEKLLRELTKSKSIGVLSLGYPDPNMPREYVVSSSGKVSIPKSKYKISVQKYMPHYTVDTTTKEVVNQSKKPLNPAIKLRVDEGKKRYEQWLWSKFPSSPHQTVKFPFETRFTDFDLGDTQGQYFIVASPKSGMWLFNLKGGKKQFQKAVFGQAYPFAKKEYSFTIEELTYGATVITEWKSGSETLANPAIIATIKGDEISQQVVLELNKPIHHEIDGKTVLLLYRNQQKKAVAK